MAISSKRNQELIGARAARRYRPVRTGKGTTVFTIGYEKRTGEELISMLIDAGVEVLADIREKPVSRKPDFPAAALRATCELARISYENWSSPAFTEEQRSKLQMSGDFQVFEQDFRAYAEVRLVSEIDQLSELANAGSGIALLRMLS